VSVKFGEHCPQCGRLHSNLYRDHVCPPRWWVSTADVRDDEDERIEVYALDPAEAAEQFAQDYWCEEPPGQDEELDVAVFVDGKPQPYTVSASWELEVHASKQDAWKP
jgi:hypothetical protein